MPSPDEQHPGLLIRDPLGYSEGMLVCPPPLVPFLRFFDGAHEPGALETALRESGAGDEAGRLAAHLADSLTRAGFLDDAAFASRRELKHAAFARAPRRDSAHAGSAYPEDAQELRALLEERMDGQGAPPPRRPGAGAPRRLVGIAAPHASPDGAWDSYRAAYRRLGGQGSERTVVVLGTSHYGAPNRFGLTRKAYVTPLGEAPTDVGFVEALLEAGGPAVVSEDYCHAVEHSIEFQVVFLQHVLGGGRACAPVLCGPFTGGFEAEGTPQRPRTSREWPVSSTCSCAICAREREPFSSCWGWTWPTSGVAMATACRLVRGEASDATSSRETAPGWRGSPTATPPGFWSRVSFAGDSLNWCGTSPFYTFLRVAPRGPRRAAALRAVADRSRECRELCRPRFPRGRRGG